MNGTEILCKENSISLEARHADNNWMVAETMLSANLHQLLSGSNNTVSLRSQTVDKSE